MRGPPHAPPPPPPAGSCRRRPRGRRRASLPGSALVAAAVWASCSCPAALRPAAAQTVADVVASTPELSKLSELLQLSPVARVALRVGGPVTLFAPTDAAFAQLPSGVHGMLGWRGDVLRRVLLYHVVSGASLSVAQLTGAGPRGMLSFVSNEGGVISTTFVELRTDPAGGVPRTWQSFEQRYPDNASAVWDSAAPAGQSLEVRKGLQTVSDTLPAADALWWQEVKHGVVVRGDVSASNGVIHYIDSVLLPSGMPAGTYSSAVDLCPVMFRAAVNAVPALAAELRDANPVTIFAPNDQAFAAFGATSVSVFAKHDGLYQDPAKLGRLLRYHFVPGYRTSAQLAGAGQLSTMDSGSSVSYSGDELTDFHSTTAALQARNTTSATGIVHVIDAVLRPEGLEIPGTLTETGADLTKLDVILVAALAACLLAIGCYFLYTGSAAAYQRQRKRDTANDLEKIQKELAKLKEQERQEDYFLSLQQRKEKAAERASNASRRPSEEPAQAAFAPAATPGEQQHQPMYLEPAPDQQGHGDNDRLATEIAAALSQGRGAMPDGDSESSFASVCGQQPPIVALQPAHWVKTVDGVTKISSPQVGRAVEGGDATGRAGMLHAGYTGPASPNARRSSAVLSPYPGTADAAPPPPPPAGRARSRAVPRSRRDSSGLAGTTHAGLADARSPQMGPSTLAMPGSGRGVPRALSVDITSPVFRRAVSDDAGQALHGGRRGSIPADVSSFGGRARAVRPQPRRASAGRAQSGLSPVGVVHAGSVSPTLVC
eukprot:TRINITY_DN3127_c0_g1_i1.p1 TRINITY_DN3127_c0_g1~~TRINITY_DN3127_c0_g1_i1.p1  ORF type:complete len:772 (+),score=141.38 TRINITY_DN3127_c0_g1_i1:78-2393(+)